MASINNKGHGHKCFYKYTSVEVAKIALVNRTIRWSSPIKFWKDNDPLDVPRELILGFEEEEFLEALVDEIAKIVENPKVAFLDKKPKLKTIVQNLRAIPEEFRKRFISEMRRLVPQKADSFIKPLGEFLEYWKRWVPRMRIICLSELKDSMSMWFHYADNHRGVVLALDCIEEIDSPWLIARPVIYQNDPPLLAKEALIRSIIGKQPLDYEQFCFDCMHIKKTDWAYEKEWRVVTTARSGESGLYSDYAIHPRNFGAVYLGQNISEEDEKDLIALLDYELSHMSAYRTILMPRECRLHFNKIR
jgi:hypothetical protein